VYDRVTILIKGIHTKGKKRLCFLMADGNLYYGKQAKHDNTVDESEQSDKELHIRGRINLVDCQISNGSSSRQFSVITKNKSHIYYKAPSESSRQEWVSILNTIIDSLFDCEKFLLACAYGHVRLVREMLSKIPTGG
jgi:hypothetical protein